MCDVLNAFEWTLDKVYVKNIIGAYHLSFILVVLRCRALRQSSKYCKQVIDSAVRFDKVLLLPSCRYLPTQIFIKNIEYDRRVHDT